MKQFLLGCVCAGALALISHGYAGPSHYPQPEQSRKMENIAERLNLTESQQQRFSEIHESLGRQKNKRAVHKLMSQLMAMDPESETYDSDVAELAHRSAERARTRVMATAEAHRQIYELLTPEQRQKAHELHQQMKEKHRKRKEHAHHWHLFH